MPRIKDKSMVTFGDGVMDLCKVENRTIVATKQKNVRFGNYTKGFKRYFEAKLASYTVDRVIKTLPIPGISKMDICIIGGEQYKIVLISDKFDATPPHLLITLERIVAKYKDVRE